MPLQRAYTGLYCSLSGSFIVRWESAETGEKRWSRVDSSGTILWDIASADTLGGMSVFSDCHGGLFIYHVRDSTLSRLNAAGAYIFQNAPMPQNLSDQTWLIKASPITGLNIPFFDIADSLWKLARYDTSGNAQWSDPIVVLDQEMSEPGVYRQQALACDSRGGTILGFATWIGPEEEQGWRFTRVDAYGNIGSSLHTDQHHVVLLQEIQVTAFPNPFNPSTNLSFDIANSGRVTLKVYDLLGREVKTLLDETRTAGKYSATFDGSALPSGIYFARLQTGNEIKTQKMVLLK
jgi:hypothetical protein